MEIALIIILIIICCFLIYKLNQKHKIDTTQEQETLNRLNSSINQLEEKNAELKEEKEKLNTDISSIQFGIILEQKRLKENQDINNDLENKISQNRTALESTIEQNKEISDKAFESYFNTLEYKYTEIEQNFDGRVAQLNSELYSIQEDLDRIKATRAAAHEALLKEKEIKDNKDDYRLTPSESDLADARRLEIVKRELNKPRILAMLVWQTYWQPLAKKQFPLILKGKDAMGIYKITNQITDECYIGQAVDVYKRWCEHCKCGLGIDTPPGNKLYKAMQEYGLENFTFELLMECSNLELNEKERYFIELYQSNTFGYNSTGGNK